MRTYSILAFLMLATTSLYSQEKAKDPATVTQLWEPKVKKVAPGNAFGDPPSDAVILFDGKDLSKWSGEKGGDAKWDVKDGAMTVVKGAAGIKTRQTFGDIQLHLEWREPLTVSGEGQGRGNSGVFFQERYELQVLDSYENETYVNGQAGAMYKQYPPLVNATRKPGEWQSYDVVFTAPRFSDNGALIVPAHITVFHNGVLVQNNSTLWGPTENVGSPRYSAHGKGSLMLQDHGDPVSYRNIWVREL